MGVIRSPGTLILHHKGILDSHLDPDLTGYTVHRVTTLHHCNRFQQVKDLQEGFDHTQTTLTTRHVQQRPLSLSLFSSHLGGHCRVSGSMKQGDVGMDAAVSHVRASNRLSAAIYSNQFTVL